MLWLIITGDKDKVSKPDSAVVTKPIEFKTAKKEWIDWLSRDQVAMGCIKGACEDSQLPYIVECKNLKEMWARLKTMHQENQS